MAPFDFESSSERSEIDDVADFAKAFMEFLEQNGMLFDATTKWSKGRLTCGQQGFLMLHMAMTPEAFGIKDSD